MKHILRTNVCGILFTYNLGSTEISVYLGSTTKVGQFKNSADSKPSCETRYVDVVITVTVVSMSNAHCLANSDVVMSTSVSSCATFGFGEANVRFGVGSSGASVLLRSCNSIIVVHQAVRGAMGMCHCVGCNCCWNYRSIHGQPVGSRNMPEFQSQCYSCEPSCVVSD